MRSAPAVRAVVNFGGVWRAAVGGWALLSGSVGVWWLVGLHDSLQPALLGTLTVAIVACVAAALTTTRTMPRVLHWDGQTWRLHVTSANDVRDGRVAPAVDLGGWMLLRFDVNHDASATWRQRCLTPARWFPVQRRGLEREWHLLRCAVHAPQPLGPTT